MAINGDYCSRCGLNLAQHCFDGARLLCHDQWAAERSNTFAAGPTVRPVRIARNAAQCGRCGDVVESRSVHDFRTCRCGGVSVDGGLDYIKRSVVEGVNVLDLSCYEGEEPPEAGPRPGAIRSGSGE